MAASAGADAGAGAWVLEPVGLKTSANPLTLQESKVVKMLRKCRRSEKLDSLYSTLWRVLQSGIKHKNRTEVRGA